MASGVDGRWPRWTVAIAVAVTVAFGLQIALAPEVCQNARYPAFCAELALLSTSPWVGFLLMPFLHGSLLHLGSNLLGFLVFGSATERWYGPRQFLWLFLAAGYLSTVVQVQSKLLAGATPVSVGISGGVFGLGAFVGVMLFPDSRAEARRLLDTAADDVEASLRPPLLVVGLLTIGYALLTHLGVVPVAPESATLSHLVGAGFGAVSAVYLRLRDGTDRRLG